MKGNIERQGSFPALNQWDTIRWMADDLLKTVYGQIMADSIQVHDIVAVIPGPRQGAETSVPEQKIVAVGYVTEVNFADSGKGGQGDGWLIKVRDESGPGTTLENLYPTDSYEFYLLMRPGEDEGEGDEE
jgi:hypothetical protein